MINKLKYIYPIGFILVFLAYQAGFAQINMDGTLVDWRKIKPVVVLDKPEQLHESPGNWQGPKDLSGKIYITRDSDNIYIAAEVRDDKPLWNPHGTLLQTHGWNATYDGDALRVLISSGSNSTEIFLFPGHYGISPSIQILMGTSVKPNQMTDGKIVSSYGNKFSGYILEASIPMKNLGLDIESALYQFELFDGDGQITGTKSLISKPVPIPIEK